MAVSKIEDNSYLSSFEADRADRAQRLIFVTNRGPVEHAFGADGSFQAQRGAGGVVSGLLCAVQDRPVSWIALAMTDADRAVAEEIGKGTLDAPAGLTNVSARLVSVPAEMYQRYYDGFSNRILWFAHHGLLRPDTFTAESHLDWAQGYRPVNKAVAQAVVDELNASGETTPVMFQDYHLYLAPEMVRARKPHARLQHFIHIPWPTVQEWSAVPVDYVHAIYRGLAANDVIGFQTQRDADHFLDGALRFLPGATILRRPDEIFWRGRRTQVRVYPIAVTPETITASAQAPEAQEQARQILRELGIGNHDQRTQRKLILRVDRLEPTKNIARGFEAYEWMLERAPHLHGRVSFLALLVPTREGLEEYQDYAEQVRMTIARINQRFGRPDWQPITAIYGNDHARALACMQEYDVLLVNPLADGMNLVVKEGGILNRRNGAIILSKTAGAYEQLASGVFGIEPRDVEATAQALYQALMLSEPQRAELADRVRAVLFAEDAGKWLNHQYADLLRYTAPRQEQPAHKLVSLPTQEHAKRVDEQRSSSAKTLPLAQRAHLLRGDGLSPALLPFARTGYPLDPLDALDNHAAGFE